MVLKIYITMSTFIDTYYATLILKRHSKLYTPCNKEQIFLYLLSHNGKYFVCRCPINGTVPVCSMRILKLGFFIKQLIVVLLEVP